MKKFIIGLIVFTSLIIGMMVGIAAVNYSSGDIYHGEYNLEPVIEKVGNTTVYHWE